MKLNMNSMKFVLNVLSFDIFDYSVKKNEIKTILSCVLEYVSFVALKHI